MKNIRNFRRYFIVGTNDSGLKDTMNGMVIGELIHCKDCQNRMDVYIDNVPYKIRCKITHNVISAMDFCSWAEREK